VLPQNITHDPQILYSLNAAQIWCMRILSLFVTRPCPDPVSNAKRLMMYSFSCLFKNLAVSGLSGRIFQITNDRATGMRPSRMKLGACQWILMKPYKVVRTSIATRNDLRGSKRQCHAGVKGFTRYTDRQFHPSFRCRRPTSRRRRPTSWPLCRKQPFDFGLRIFCTRG